MKQGIELMKELGFIDETDEQETAARIFKKYDDEGFITDTINFFYNRETGGVQVFTNDLRYGGGSRLDKELLNVITINFNELQGEMEK